MERSRRLSGTGADRAFQAVVRDTEVSENRLPLTPLFAFAGRHCCPATQAKKVRSAALMWFSLFRINRSDRFNPAIVDAHPEGASLGQADTGGHDGRGETGVQKD